MPDIKPEQFKSRFDKAKGKLYNWHSTLEETYDLFLPNRQTYVEYAVGERRFTQLFSSKGTQALQEFSNSIKSKLLPSYQEWATIRPSGKVEAELVTGQVTQDARDELARQMQQVNRILFKYIWGSNFDQVAHEAIQDMAVSTGAILCLDTNDVDRPINFVCVPSNELIPERGANGSIETVFREHKVAARNIMSSFPKAKDDKAIREMAADNPDKEVKVIEGTIHYPEDNNYKYIVYISIADRKMFYEEVLEVSPWIVFRWNVKPNEVLGTGPALNATPDMSVLNTIKRQLLFNNDMAINPPLIVNSSNVIEADSIRIAPGGLLPIKGDYQGNSPAFQYLETRSRFDIGVGTGREYETSIDAMFFLPQLGNVDAATKSATEIQIRNNQALAQMTSAFGRLQQELVSKVIKRVAYVLSRYDIIPKELMIDGVIAEVQATSPLARVQDSADLEGLMQFIQTSFSLGEAGQALLASTVDVSKLGNFMADKMGVPAELKLTQEQREQQAQVVQQQLQQQQAQQVQGQV